MTKENMLPQNIEAKIKDFEVIMEDEGEGEASEMGQSRNAPHRALQEETSRDQWNKWFSPLTFSIYL